MTALGWTVATAVGFALVGLIPCNRDGLEVFFFGALGSLPQALFLFRHGRLGSAVAWPIVTAIAVPLAYFVAMFTTLVPSQAFPGAALLWLIASFVVAGLIVGAAQSVALGLALRPRAALRWVAASALGGPAAGAFLLMIVGLLVIEPIGRASLSPIPFASESGCTPNIPRPVLGLLLGALYGAITGAVLERSLRDTASA